MLKKINVEQIRAGMYVQELCGSWLDNPFWKTAFMLHDESDVRKLLDSGVKELWINTKKGGDVLSVASSDSELSSEQAGVIKTTEPPQGFIFKPEIKQEMDQELAQAHRIIRRSKDAVADMFENARMGRIAHPEIALAIVDDIAGSVLRNSGALISLIRLKQADEYTYLHSVAVCAMMIALGKHLKLSDSSIRDCGLGGLLHDIGKMSIPIEILNKPASLTEQEYEKIKSHPKIGHEMLSQVGGIPDSVLDICRHHHERTDGKGYPDQLSGKDFSLFARMAAICDVYDAVTSNRPYKQGWSPTESLRKMSCWTKDGHLDATIFAALVRCIGIYPVGTLVRLKSDRLAVVSDNDKSLLQPKVRVFFSIKSMVYLPPESIDLSRPGVRDEILSSEEPETWCISELERYWAQ
ncbi:DUF3391 domain-containing protein [Duganella sp. FT80W]|uniref:DUF3391 domain-containing protein n=1 Tax=Duganella guangzhouensis TaxID=2666084 RepID=A0A6I2LDB9_9BURK|nr:HD-GYP domain-containing protein [Duganella guangzhouensis]MRW94824.1 DUF3391 domain-containing protein [Duganella guangzhouensis]